METSAQALSRLQAALPLGEACDERQRDRARRQFAGLGYGKRERSIPWAPTSSQVRR